MKLFLAGLLVGFVLSIIHRKYQQYRQCYSKTLALKNTGKYYTFFIRHAFNKDLIHRLKRGDFDF
jgi:hypothetical protein